MSAKSILLYLWQLPQNLLGLLLFTILQPETTHDYKGVRLHYSDRIGWGVSLGTHIIVSSVYRNYNGRTELHEWGHTRQSRILGWLYLPVVGLPSLVHAALYKPKVNDPEGYYRFFTERWADRLAGIERY